MNDHDPEEQVKPQPVMPLSANAPESVPLAIPVLPSQPIRDAGPVERLWEEYERVEYPGRQFHGEYRKMLRHTFFTGVWTMSELFKKLMNGGDDQLAIELLRKVNEELTREVVRPKKDPLFGVAEDLEKINKARIDKGINN